MKAFTRYLEAQNLAPSTIHSYLMYVHHFLDYYHQDISQCTKKDILDYLHHLKEKNQQNVTRNLRLAALKHYFSFLYQRQTIVCNPTTLIYIRATKKKKLYKLYSIEEMEQLRDAYYQRFIRQFGDGYISPNQRQPSLLSHQRNYVMMGLFVYQGLSAGELQRLTPDDVHCLNAKLQVRDSKKRQSRSLPLHATQIGSLIHYTQQLREQFFAYCQETDKLFMPLPNSSKTFTQSDNLTSSLIHFRKQLHSLQPSFVNFLQIRASVITHWLQQHGLRKTQYLAGHRYISSTEQYLSNDIKNLSEDMEQFNPF